MPTPLNISASRAGAILGMSQYSTPLQVWLQIMESREPGFCEKHNYQIPEFEYNSAMKWGHAFESAVIELAEEKQGCKIVDREKLFTHPVHEYLTCHLDGIYDEHKFGNNFYNGFRDGELTLHEGKTTSAQYFYSAFGEPGTDRVPVEYQLQCQHQMICTGAYKVILSVLVFPKRVEEWEKNGITPIEKDGKWFLNFDQSEKYSIDPISWAWALDQMGYFHQYTIHAHADLQKLMLESYSDFWNNHVLTGIPPEPMNYDDIRAICREPVGTILTDSKYHCLDCGHKSESNIKKCPECSGINIERYSDIENYIAEYRSIGKEISDTGTLAKRREQLKTQILNFSRSAGFTEDDESRDKWIIRGQDGKKLASYGRTEKGIFIFR